MQIVTKRQGALMLLATLAVPVSGSLSAQQQDQGQPVITVTGAQMPAGPEIKGIISARNDDKMKVTAADGTSTIITVNDATRINAGGGFLGGNRGKFTADSLLNGLPVTVKTLQSADGLVASQVTFRNNDFKTARMIRNGTAQQFDEQTAATEALRGRMGDIDKYNIKSTTNVYFDTGRAVISATAKAELCATATQAEAMNNALMLVVGYTDSGGSD